MSTRKFWLDTMLKIASPVLENLAQGRLKESIPVEFHPDRSRFICLEAFGRTLCGIAPWLELDGLTGEEYALQQRYRKLTRRCLDMATDPTSPDFMNFNGGPQPLVDTAFLAHGILRAPNQLWDCLDGRVKANIIAALKSSRIIRPYANNWLFFASMVETALHSMGEEIDIFRFHCSVEKFESEWYVGDGMYGDGPAFHWDYYNSFVIQPMFADILRVCSYIKPEYVELYSTVKKRASRYARILERLIAPDGTYPVVGRSVTYRFGAFQLLSQAALQGFLPEDLPAAQVRCALTAVIAKCMENPECFDERGWLRPGVYGYQPELAEPYINVGSLYLCSSVFLPLGLLPSDPFWRDPDSDWSGKRLWSGERVIRDHAEN